MIKYKDERKCNCELKDQIQGAVLICQYYCYSISLNLAVMLIQANMPRDSIVHKRLLKSFGEVLL